jgi:hypothetical protein
VETNSVLWKGDGNAKLIKSQNRGRPRRDRMPSLVSAYGRLCRSLTYFGLAHSLSLSCREAMSLSPLKSYMLQSPFLRWATFCPISGPRLGPPCQNYLPIEGTLAKKLTISHNFRYSTLRIEIAECWATWPASRIGEAQWICLLQVEAGTARVGSSFQSSQRIDFSRYPLPDRSELETTISFPG